MTERDDSAPGTTRRHGWLHAASDRVPTKWFAGIATGLLLAATAAFGGLATAPEPAIAAIEPGEAHQNGQLSMTIERVILLDEYCTSGARRPMTASYAPATSTTRSGIPYPRDRRELRTDPLAQIAEPRERLS